MEKDSIRNAYDLNSQGYTSQNISRRDFLKKASMAGLAVAGAGALGGCALLPSFIDESKGADIKFSLFGNLRDYNRYDFDAIAGEYRRGERAIVPVNSLDDFLLTDEELGWMRLSERGERIILKFLEPNPKKERGNYMNLGSMISGFPLSEEGMLAEYVGRTNYPRYNVIIKANKFNSEEKFIEAQEKLKKWFEEREEIHKKFADHFSKKNKTKIDIREWLKERQPYLSYCRIFSKFPFLISGSGSFFELLRDPNNMKEHISRMKLYQAKRGLDVVWSDY